MPCELMPGHGFDGQHTLRPTECNQRRHVYNMLISTAWPVTPWYGSQLLMPAKGFDKLGRKGTCSAMTLVSEDALQPLTAKS